MEYRKFEQNENGQDYIVGDIHGCFSDLEQVMENVGFDKSVDRMFSVGDLTDRGPESRRAMDFLREPWFFSVMGNHEDMIIAHWRDHLEPGDLHLMNGGGWLLDETLDWIDEYLGLISNLPLIIQVGEVGILHALPPRGVDWSLLIRNPDLFRESILWERRLDPKEVRGIDVVVTGHTIGREVRRWENIICIDTGAVKAHLGMEGRLTVIKMPEPLTT